MVAHHNWRRLDEGGWQCWDCRKSAYSASHKSRLEGTACIPLQSLVHPSHRLRRTSDGAFFCDHCSAYADKSVRNLRDPCPPEANSGAPARLRKLRCGLVPNSDRGPAPSTAAAAARRDDRRTQRRRAQELSLLPSPHAEIPTPPQWALPAVPPVVLRVAQTLASGSSEVAHPQSTAAGQSQQQQQPGPLGAEESEEEEDVFEFGAEGFS